MLSIVGQPVYADKLEFNPYVSAAFTYDDNVYLLADQEDSVEITGEEQRSDNIVDAAAGLTGKYSSRDKDIKFAAQIFRRDYSQFSVLNFTGGAARFQGNWRHGKRWSTEAGYRYERNQSSFSEENLAQGDVFDLHYVDLGLTLHLGSNNELYVKAAFRDKEFEQRIALANERTDVTLGYRQFSRKKNWIALELASGDGDNPNRLSFSEGIATLQSYTEDSVKLLSSLRLGDKTKVESSVGYVDRQHNDGLSDFDYTGVVFDIDLEWDISPKTQFTSKATQRLRDTENTNTIFSKDQRLKFGFKWTTSEKLVFNTALTLLDLEFVQQGENRESTGGIFEIGAKYHFNKRSSLEPRIRIRSRDSNNIENEYDNSMATIRYRYMF